MTLIGILQVFKDALEVMGQPNSVVQAKTHTAIKMGFVTCTLPNSLVKLDAPVNKINNAVMVNGLVVLSHQPCV